MGPAWLVLALLLPAALLWLAALPPGGLGLLASAPRAGDMAQLLLQQTVLPRALMALLCGAALALSGTLLQRVLRNPIAEPATLGVSAGAQMALGAALLHAPVLVEAWPEGVALAGSATAMLLVLLLSWRQKLAPVPVVLAGLVVGLVAAAFGAALVLLHGEYLMSLFIWGGGALDQQGFGGVLGLLPRLLLAGGAAALLLRPLALLSLDDATARNLGLALPVARVAVLGVAVWLAASVTALVGVIGFIGLAAPALARLAGARAPRQVLAWAPPLGAALLWLADGLTQLAAGGSGQLAPTGAVTAMLGGPLLLWLLPHLQGVTGAATVAPDRLAPRAEKPWRLVVPLLLAVPAAALLVLALGRGPGGWFLAWGDAFADLLPWRGPRLLGAMAAGAMLAAAGTLLQRLTANPLAGPEVLGISGGAGLGLAGLLLVSEDAGRLAELGAAATGAGFALLVMLAVARRSGFAPQRLLLAGVAMAGFCGAAITGVMALGGPRAFRLLGWITGSTHDLTARDAAVAAGLALLFLAPLPWTGRWLALLPLGDASARSLGLRLALSRGLLILLAALLTAAAVLVVGPLSFIGLMAPHLARLLGLDRPLPQLAGAVAIGALLMALADLLARSLGFPYQLPVGLLVSLLGGPYLLWLLARR
jgi:iron complex transport system permease protein